MRMNHRHLRGLVRQMHNRMRVREREPPYFPPERQNRRRRNNQPANEVIDQDLAQRLPETPRREVPMEPVPAREIVDRPRRLEFDELDP